MDFCSIEEAWGNDFDTQQDETESNKFTPLNNTEQDVDVDVRMNNDYVSTYCNTIVNHVQGCKYCQKQLANIIKFNNTSNNNTNNRQNTTLSPSILTRKNDNFACVPFGLDPEVFNVLLFSLLIISFLYLLDKNKYSLFS